MGQQWLRLLDAGKGEEYFLPGVHSDVGGGYLDNGSDAGLIVS